MADPLEGPGRHRVASAGSATHLTGESEQRAVTDTSVLRQPAGPGPAIAATGGYRAPFRQDSVTGAGWMRGPPPLPSNTCGAPARPRPRERALDSAPARRGHTPTLPPGNFFWGDGGYPERRYP